MRPRADPKASENALASQGIESRFSCPPALSLFTISYFLKCSLLEKFTMTVGTGWNSQIVTDIKNAFFFFRFLQKTEGPLYSIILYLFSPLPISISHEMCLDCGMCYSFLEFLFFHLRHPKPVT
jgi:hypothetical protein